MSSKLIFLLSVAITFIVTCNVLLQKIFGRMRIVHIKTFVKKLMNFEKQMPNFMSLSRGLTNQSTNQNSNPRPDIQILGREFQICGWISRNKIANKLAQCQCILIALVFFYPVNSKTRFDETLGRISESKNLGRGNVG